MTTKKEIPVYLKCEQDQLPSFLKSEHKLQLKKFRKMVKDYKENKYDRFEIPHPNIILFIKDKPLKKKCVNVSFLDIDVKKIDFNKKLI
jgi:hypothetical protein